MVKKERWIFRDRLNRNLIGFCLISFLLVGLFLIPGMEPPNQIANAASNCATSGPSSGAYTVTVCFTSPTTGTLTGNVTFTVTASISGSSSGVQRMVFNINNGYLLTDYQSPYTFTLPTTKFVDGTYTISASALMRDAFASGPATLTVSFNNGVSTPPVNQNTFTPALGTSPGNGNPLVVVAAGDGASGEANATSVTNLIASWNPNLLLYLGDVYEKGSPTEFYNWYGNSQNFGAFRAITDPTIGNHEYTFTGNKNAPGYFDYWNNIPNYYSFTTGGWHFISLNANGQFAETLPGSGQYTWLNQDLASNTTACTVVYWHQPLYNIGIEPAQTNMQQIWALLAQYKVDIVLNGHDHDYQRWVPLDGSGNPSPTGITEFVAGGSGHGIQTFNKTDSRVAKGLDAKSKPAPFGALRLQLYATQAVFNYINTAGTILDSGTIGCNNANRTTTSTPTSTPTPILANNPTPTPTNVPATPTDTAAPTATSVAPAATSTPTATATPSSTFVLSPLADAYVISTSPDSNFGTSTSLRADASPPTLSYMMFNIQGLSGSPIKVALRIYFNSPSTTGVNIYGVNDTSWIEKGITYNNAPPINSFIVGFSGAVNLSGTWVDIDITSIITGNGLVSLAITTTNTTNISLASRESGANSPQLIVQQ